MAAENPMNLLAKAGEMTREELIALLSLEDAESIKSLHDAALEMKYRHCGNKVYYRGIIEFSNICSKDCYYCGIRKSNDNVERYRMDREEMVKEALWAWEAGYGSIVIQGGEVQSPAFTQFIEEVLLEIKEKSNGELGITLSLGEQDRETYTRWFNAGGHRYLLRVETTDSELYGKLHPEDHSFDERKACLSLLRECGYQVGTGVMIGLPGQTIENLADDILFFKEMDIDMIGMGPFIPHHQTPLSSAEEAFSSDEQLKLGLKMIAVTRLFLEDVNIASTTALQALTHNGREQGIAAGANIVMPNLTDTQYRTGYQLYDNKPCLDENSGMCRSCLDRRIQSVGESVGYREWGDSPHFLKKQKL